MASKSLKREAEQARVKRWTERLTSGTKVYKAWEKFFECERCKQYWLGKQWRGMTETEAATKYVINLIFPTINTQLPSLLFYNPQVKVEPRPARADDFGSTAGARADLIQSTLQTLIDDPKTHFKLETTLALLDAEFRFGVVEVGYTADWIDNPQADQPVLKENSNDPLLDKSGAPVLQPKRTLTSGSERIFVKRISPEAVRVSLSGKNAAEANDWIAYSEWHYVEDLKANKDYQNTDKLKASGQMEDGRDAGSDESEDERLKHIGMVKLWKIWDLRTHVKHVIADGCKAFLQESVEAPFFPLAFLKYYEIPDQFYPVPPVSNWLSPQDEINEIRESRRTHRRRFVRRYTVKKGAMDPAELEKLLNTGEDGTYADRNTDEDPIRPVQDADLSAANTSIALSESQDDFRQITGVSGEQLQVPEAQTATQANIANTKSQVRESSLRVLVAEFLSQISRLMLFAVREHMQESFWVQMNVDPFAQNAQGDAQQTQGTWQQIDSESIDELDVDIKIDIASLSPVTEDAQRAAWNQVLVLLTNPQLLTILMASEPILRKTLGFYGIKSDSEVKEIQRVGQMLVMQQHAQMMAQMMAKGGGQPPGGGMGLPGLPGPQGAPAGMPSAPPGIQ